VQLCRLDSVVLNCLFAGLCLLWLQGLQGLLCLKQYLFQSVMYIEGCDGIFV
jgi:hypothetical protein